MKIIVVRIKENSRWWFIAHGWHVVDKHTHDDTDSNTYPLVFDAVVCVISAASCSTKVKENIIVVKGLCPNSTLHVCLPLIPSRSTVFTCSCVGSCVVNNDAILA